MKLARLTFGAIAAITLLLGASPSFAAEASANIPDTSNILFIQNLRKMGATVYYLGQDMGVNGWFVVKDGQVQILYTTPDQKAVMVGALLSAEGANVSQQQVMVLAKNNPEVEKVLKGSAAVTGQIPSNKKAEASPSLPPIQAAPVQASAPHAAAPEAASSSANSPSEKFFEALLKSANTTFGINSAPQLLMIMDVNCPHCHKTWKEFQPLVDSGKLRVTMIPVGALGPESEVQAANWLASKDVYASWKKHVDGDEAIFKTEQPSAANIGRVHDNTDLIQKWGVDQTPYILYHGKNGKVRLIVGEPKSIDEIMSDIK